MTNNHQSLTNWLDKISTIHPKEISLGLDRIQAVAQQMHLTQPQCPVVIVGGTNGKGSTVTTLEKIYNLQGYRTGVFTSPILYRHNEMLRLQGREAEDHWFCEAYAKIEAARKDISLTPFEYHTLAVLEIMSRHDLDVWILEVGLGGRLDAVNIMDADVAIVTSIGIDHVDWLGDTRELIATEKAGIFRANHPAVCGDFDPPATLIDHAKKLSAPLYCQGKEFSFTAEKDSWAWKGKTYSYTQLPFSQLAPQNISSALMAIELLQTQLPVSEENIREGIKTVFLSGRIEIRKGEFTEIRDVAHNPASVAFLVDRLKQLPRAKKTRAVFSMLADKDIAASIREIQSQIDEWYVAPLAVKRGASKEMLEKIFREENILRVKFFETIEESYQAAKVVSGKEDYLLVFGSFHTVASA